MTDWLNMDKLDISKMQNPILPPINGGGASLVTGGGGYGVSTLPPLQTTPQTSGWMDVLKTGILVAGNAFNASLQPVIHPTTAAPATPTAATSLNMSNLPKYLLIGAGLTLLVAVGLKFAKGR